MTNITEAQNLVAQREAALQAALAGEAQRAEKDPVAVAERELNEAKAKLAAEERAAIMARLEELRAEGAAICGEILKLAPELVRVYSWLGETDGALGTALSRSRFVAREADQLAGKLQVSSGVRARDPHLEIRIQLGAALKEAGRPVVSPPVDLLDPVAAPDNATHRENERRHHAEMVQAGRDALAEVEKSIKSLRNSGVNKDDRELARLEDRRRDILRGLGREAA
jgi:hypothetical protein